jgi:hypothetical protein
MTTMPSQKLFIFKASHANISVIIRKNSGKKENYQMIRWDMSNNTFVEGQWLLNKQLFIQGCAISPDGQHFGWIYNQYGRDNHTHAGISVIPYFTAVLYSPAFLGRWYVMQFNRDSQPIDKNKCGFITRRETQLIVSTNTLPVPSGLQPPMFIHKIDERVYRIEVDQYKVLVDGQVVYDAADNQFVNIEAA